ncbi:uncharacterized protein PV09_06017 [Verruconis gallopava]|uniref:DUF7053 domain-containing protein n=1 Tax=Verruconis gallopava TaxID=253628 RepID=A0A0D1YPL4_9PEZI|nr:uncharacterized protein PV09_06017 [Verruconis gallopava]KIW02562.1 hypothetical protein PV09_06017 [Verruconis gallopava]
MSKRTVFTTITPLPSFLTKEVAISFLHDHWQMIDLNPLVIDRKKLDSPPPNASPEECHASWYQITDKITYMPGVQSSVSYNACLHDLADGLQTHTFAPAGVEIRARWLIGGGKGAPSELGLNVPSQGLYLQEETDLKCNFLMTGFIKKNLKKAHAQVVEKIVAKGRELEPRPPVPPKDEGYRVRDPSQALRIQNPQPGLDGAPRSPTYSQFASNSNPDLSSAPNRYPPGYLHYRQDTEPAFSYPRPNPRPEPPMTHQRINSVPEQNMLPSSRVAELPSETPQPRPRPISELPG